MTGKKKKAIRPEKELSVLEKNLLRFEAKTGMKGSDVAAHLGVHPSIYTRIKKRNLVRSPHIATIARLFETTPRELIEDSYWPVKWPVDQNGGSIYPRTDTSKEIDRLVAEDRLTLRDQVLILSLARELANDT